MRIFIKIILFPLTLAPSITVLLLHFLVEYGGALASIVAGLLFTIGVVLVGGKLMQVTGVANSSWGTICIPFVFAFLLSPYGLTGLVALIADGLDSFNGLLKSI